MSVENLGEFTRIMKEDFFYDMTVCAFNLNIALNSVLAAGYGSPEVNKIKDKKSFKLSCEFPSPINNNFISGGIYLFKLGKINANKLMIKVD